MAKVLMKGNEAIAEAAIQAGCRFFLISNYAQNEIPAYMAKMLPKVGGCFLQAESRDLCYKHGIWSSGSRC